MKLDAHLSESKSDCELIELSFTNTGSYMVDITQIHTFTLTQGLGLPITLSGVTEIQDNVKNL